MSDNTKSRLVVYIAILMWASVIIGGVFSFVYAWLTMGYIWGFWPAVFVPVWIVGSVWFVREMKVSFKRLKVEND